MLLSQKMVGIDVHHFKDTGMVPVMHDVAVLLGNSRNHQHHLNIFLNTTVGK
jgi:hypothetical protein